MTFYKWSKTAATNASADSTINWAEGQAPSSINDSARAEMAANAKWRDDISGTLTTTGSSTAYALTTNQVFSTAALMSGAMITFIPHATSGASPTLAVDGLTARAINKSTGVAVATGQLIIGTPYVVSYIHATTEFVLQGYTEVFGNVTVNGTTLLTGVATFTGAPVFNGGAALGTGTYTGAATFSGALVLSAKVGFTNTTAAYGLSGGTTAQRNGSPTAGDTRFNTSLNVLEYWDGTRWVLSQATTRQYLTSGTAATYTTPAGCRSIIVKMIAGGGGGGATATNNGSTGGTTTFNSITVIGGGGGVAAGTVGRSGGVGGAGGTGSASLRLPGSAGGNGSANTTGGGNGGSGMFGAGAGLGAPAANNSAGAAAAANTGAGGGGATSATNAAGGGGAGEYAEIVIASPSATYTYTVGAVGAGGTAGTNVGGNGGTGMIIVEEYY